MPRNSYWPNECNSGELSYIHTYIYYVSVFLAKDYFVYPLYTIYLSLSHWCIYVCMFVRSISYSRRMLCGISEWLILPPPPPPRFYLISEITFSSYSIRRRHPFFFYHWPCLGYRAAAAVVVFWLSTIIKIYCVLSGLSKMAGSDINEPASQPAGDVVSFCHPLSHQLFGRHSNVSMSLYI